MRDGAPCVLQQAIQQHVSGMGAHLLDLANRLNGWHTTDRQGTTHEKSSGDTLVAGVTDDHAHDNSTYQHTLQRERGIVGTGCGA